MKHVPPLGGKAQLVTGIEVVVTIPLGVVTVTDRRPGEFDELVQVNGTAVPDWVAWDFTMTS